MGFRRRSSIRLRIFRNSSFGAATALLDRGWGRPMQMLDQTVREEAPHEPSPRPSAADMLADWRKRKAEGAGDDSDGQVEH